MALSSKNMMKRSKDVVNSLVRMPQRQFLNKMNIPNVSEEDVNQRMNQQSHTYHHNDTLVFDYQGRYMIYDCLAYTLKGFPGITNTLLTIGLYYGAYNAFYAVPYVAKQMYIWGGLASVTSLFNIGRYLDRRQSFIRMYLLQNLSVVRLEDGNGNHQDIPISGIKVNNYNQTGGILTLNVNGSNKQLKITQASFFEPSLLYAITHPSITQLDGSIAHASQ